jgi:hypothetical protein
LHLNALLITKTAFLENAMFRLLKVLPLTLALTAVSFFFTGCGGNNAQARFINAIPDSGPLDIEVGGVKEFSTVQFGTVSPGSNYAGVPSGNVALEGFQSGSTTQAFPSQTVNLNSGSEYTLVAVGFLSSGNVDILNPVDNNTEPQDSMVNFRVIEASPSGPKEVDIYFIANPVECQLGATGCTAAISGLAYQSTSTYVPLSFNSNGQGYQMFVTPHLSTTPVPGWGAGQTIIAGGTTLGSIRTMVLTDQSGVLAMSSTALVLHDLN